MAPALKIRVHTPDSHQDSIKYDNPRSATIPLEALLRLGYPYQRREVLGGRLPMAIPFVFHVLTVLLAACTWKPPADLQTGDIIF
jgi:hypothetical protein